MRACLHICERMERRCADARENVKALAQMQRICQAVGMSSDYSPPQHPLVILHDDAEILAVDKPAGLLSVPGKGEHLADCLIARVQAVWPQALLVHRLDRDTSGVIVFGLTLSIIYFIRQFA